jgi:hypothetical protein
MEKMILFNQSKIGYRWVAQARERARQGSRTVQLRMSFSRKYHTYIATSVLTQILSEIGRYIEQDKCQD